MNYPINPAFLHGLFPRIEERRVDPKDSLLITRMTLDGKKDPTFNVVAVRPAMVKTGEGKEATLEVFLAPNAPGTSYEFVLYPAGLPPLRLGAFRFNPGQVCDLLPAIVTAEHRTAIRVPASYVGLGNEVPRYETSDIKQARRVAAKLFGPELTESEPSPDLAPELTAA